MAAQVKSGVFGASGRMGQAILAASLSDGNFDIVTAITSPENKLNRQPVADSIQGLNSGLAYKSDPTADDMSEADVIIDFTIASSASQNIQLAVEAQKPLVIGTSGLSDENRAELAEAAKVIPVVHAPNTSLGITMMKVLAEKAAKALDMSFDIEIHEAHHRSKVDAPSGTANMVIESLAAARGQTAKDVANYHRHGHIGQRPEGEIGVTVSRGGNLTCDHDINFYGNDEVLTISHRGLNRNLYAQGAIKAAKWIVGKAPGLYSMEDVLGLN